MLRVEKCVTTQVEMAGGSKLTFDLRQSYPNVNNLTPYWNSLYRISNNRTLSANNKIEAVALTDVAMNLMQCNQKQSQAHKLMCKYV
jgi:P pilus assembly chaperone PapD